MNQIDPNLNSKSARVEKAEKLSRRVTRLEMLVSSPTSKSLPRSTPVRNLVPRSQTINSIPKKTATVITTLSFIVMMEDDATEREFTLPISESFSFITSQLEDRYIGLKTTDGSRIRPSDPLLLVIDPSVGSDSAGKTRLIAFTEISDDQVVDLDYSYDDGNNVEFSIGDRLEALVFKDSYWAWRVGVVNSVSDSGFSIKSGETILENVPKDCVRCVTLVDPNVTLDLIPGSRIQVLLDKAWFAATVVGLEANGRVNVVRIGGLEEGSKLGIRSLRWRLRSFEPRGAGEEIQVALDQCKVGWHCQLANKIVG